MNNLLHTYSSKPLLRGTQDAILVALITVIIVVLFAAVYYYFTDNLKYMATSEYWKTVGKTFMTSLVLGYVYEYGGINAKFSAESMRFAKGSTLDKYQSRNSALVAETAAKQYKEEIDKVLANNPECKFNDIELKRIQDNTDKITAMVKSTRELKLISRMYNEPADKILSELKSRYQTKLSLSDIEHLKNLDADAENNLSRLNAVPRLVELFGANEDLIQYFIKNGFSKLRSIETKSGWTVDVKKLSADTGVTINTIGVKI